MLLLLVGLPHTWLLALLWPAGLFPQSHKVPLLPLRLLLLVLLGPAGMFPQVLAVLARIRALARRLQGWLWVYSRLPSGRAVPAPLRSFRRRSSRSSSKLIRGLCMLRSTREAPEGLAPASTSTR